MNFQLCADKVTITVSNRANPILFETSINILPGEFVIIVGHNGSGKSSLIKVLSGLRKPSDGSVSVFNQPISTIPSAIKAIDIVTLSQTPEDRLFPELTLEENILLWESRFPAHKRLTPLDVINLTKLPKKFSDMSQPIKTLSGGEKQILLIACVLAHSPRLLFLDEPTASLDPKAASEVMQFTANAAVSAKITTLMVTHSLDDALRYGNRLIILNEGRVVFDKQKPLDLSINQLKSMMDAI